jgi:hypothetical protein
MGVHSSKITFSRSGRSDQELGIGHQGEPMSPTARQTAEPGAGLAIAPNIRPSGTGNAMVVQIGTFAVK